MSRPSPRTKRTRLVWQAGGGAGPEAAREEARAELAGEVLRSAEASVDAARAEMRRVGAGRGAHPQAHDTLVQARAALRTLGAQVAQHCA